jgi:hypothetical protein
LTLSRAAASRAVREASPSSQTTTKAYVRASSGTKARGAGPT